VCKTDSSIEKVTTTKDLVAQRTSVVEARTTVAQKELSVSFGGKLTHAGKSVDAQILVDSGATHSFIHQRILDRNQWKGKPLERPFNVLNADGSTNQAGKITQELRLPLTIGTIRHYETFYVSNTGKDDIILGMTWLRNYNPRIDWIKQQIQLGDGTIINCQEPDKLRLIHALKQYLTSGRERPIEEVPDDFSDHQGEALPRDSPQILEEIKTSERSEGTKEPEESNKKRPNKISIDWITEQPDFHQYAHPLLWNAYEGDLQEAIDEGNDLIWIRTKHTVSQSITEKLHQNKPEKTLEEMIPPEFLGFRFVFEKHASERLPERKIWDHAIDLKEDAPKQHNCKVYPLSKPEQEELDNFLKEHLRKGYIRESTSPIAAPFFFVKKKEGTLRPIQDYRWLNGWTVKNNYPLPLIPELLDKLQEASIFSKLDVRWGYNNIRIKEGHEYKAAFKTNRGLFEPTVMFFGLTNSPATFQSMMNAVFADLIDTGQVVIYMDDILIFTKDRTTHKKLVQLVLQRLQDNNLFLKPEKCSFYQTRIEYLGLVISHNSIEMDEGKLSAIKDWPIPRRLKDVQSFLGFGNFYQRFIARFSEIAQPLYALTKKGTTWNWDNACQQAFDKLKQAFITAPVLVMPNTTQPFRVETDASGYAMGAVLSQQDEEGKWHPCAFLSQSMAPAERNYNIYDKELLAIIRALEEWRHYLEGADHTVKIITDHKNLSYF
jgi:hypothetical protein